MEITELSTEGEYYEPSFQQILWILGGGIIESHRAFVYEKSLTFESVYEYVVTAKLAKK